MLCVGVLVWVANRQFRKISKHNVNADNSTSIFMNPETMLILITFGFNVHEVNGIKLFKIIQHGEVHNLTFLVFS